MKSNASPGFPPRGSRVEDMHVACDCASRVFFQMLVMRLIKMTLNGHPCRMPYVAAKKEQSHPIILKQQVGCVYIPDNALCVPGCMPCSRVTRSTTCLGIKSKHLT